MPYNIYPWYLDNTNAPQHYRTTKKNQSIAWSGTDTAELYQKNLCDPLQRELLEQYNWLDPIEYKYNNHGFRADAFDDRPAGLALGCSFTEGIGLPIDLTWVSMLSKMSNAYIWNLGVGGSAFDTVFRLLDYYLLKFNPKFVCILVPPMNRLEYCGIHNNYPIITANVLNNHTSFAKEWLSQEQNGIQNRRKNMLAIKQICHEATIPVYFVDSVLGFEIENRDYARDLLHYGVESQKYITNEFYNQMKEHHGI